MNHLNRKSICVSQFSDISVDDLKAKIEQESMSKKTHQCNECNKAFSHISGLEP